MSIARALANLVFSNRNATEAADLKSEFARRGPWITKFTIDGESYGGWFDALNDPRVEQFRKAFPSARSVMELGSLEGGHSIALARQPAVERVLALEGRAANIERAEFVTQLLRVHTT